MKCPHCHGRGTVTRRLWFITWQRPCAQCDGTGKAGVQRPQSPWRDDDWRSRADDSLPLPLQTGPSRDRDEAFAAGGGGESGGAGGGGSWGDPVIVDPFAADAPGAGEASATDAGLSAEADESGSDGGTAY